MKIRRYMGSNAQEAILKVKMDLGNDALILNTRKVRKKGILNIFSKPMVEVLAAIDDDFSSKKDKDIKRQDEINKDTSRDVEQVNNNQSNEKISELEGKVSTMESLLQKIYNQLQTTERFQSETKEEERTSSKVLQVLYNNLIKNEVEDNLAKEIIDSVREKLGDRANFDDAAPMIFNKISKMLGTPEVLELRNDGKPTVVILIGPTGVGKTTTLAKIAANFALNQKKKVGLMTADTYRIAAVEQLKTYSEILGLPVKVIYSINEIEDGIKQYADKDLILIDTAGRSYRNKTQFEELKALVMASNADEVFLVLSTVTSMRNCREILNNYSFLENYKLIFTKLDETPISGIILNAKSITNKKLSYVTTGQSVPDDIEVANIDKITKNLLGSIN